MKRIRIMITKAIAGSLAALTMLGSTVYMPGRKADKVYAAKIKSVKINSTTFPDNKFRAYVKETFDSNNDNTLDSDEILVARNIWCDGMGIESLKGIEYLVELRGLYCTKNKIKTMDLSKNQLITGVWCSDNLFTSMDLSTNPTLEWLYCYNCNIKTLNVADNPKLSYLECNSNPLTGLDVSHNPLLEHLTCGDCGLKKLDVSHNPNLQHLDAFRNKFKKLDVTKCPKMKRLDIWDNPGLGSIDVSKCPGLQYYNCANNKATNVDVSHNPELTKLICSYNRSYLKTLDVTHNPKLVYLDCAVNEIKSLNLKNNKYLYFLQAFTNKFKKLNIGENPFLVKTYKHGVKRAEYKVCKGHSWTIDYGGDTSTGKDNIYFLCFDDGVKLSTKSSSKKSLNSETSRPGDNVNLPPKNQRITREMMVQTLYKMAGSPDVSGLKSRFKDVKKGAWYEKALLWGEKNSICVGYPYVSSDNFGIGKCIEIQDVLFMLMRYAEYMDYNRSIDFGRSDDFIDYYDVDYYVWEAVCWAATHNILVGKGSANAPKSERRIDPHGKATRSEIKTFIKRMLEVNGVKVTSIPIPNKSYLPKKSGSKDAASKYISSINIKKNKLVLNAKIADKKSGGKYKITKVTKKSGKITGGTVTYMMPYLKNNKTYDVPDSVKLGGVTFKVTAVNEKAFKGCKSLTEVTIGKNVKAIGAKAFYGDKKLVKIKLKTRKLKKTTVGKNVLKGTSSKLKITVPKKVRKTYKKIFKSKGNKKVRINY